MLQNFSLNVPSGKRGEAVMCETISELLQSQNHSGQSEDFTVQDRRNLDK